MVLELAKESSGIDFLAYKAPTMRRRVEHRMTKVHCRTYAQYMDRLRRDPGEAVALLDALLVKTTSMFRHPPTTTVLRDIALPGLFRLRKKERAATVRGWVIGCSSGEEAFSLAMCFREAAYDAPNIDLRLLATDVDRGALERVASGNLSESARADIPPPFDRFVEPTEQGYRVSDEIRAMISPAYHDILALDRPAPQSAVVASFDVVSCRNLIIYLDRPARTRVISRLVKSCAPGAILVLGEAEAPISGLDGVTPVVPGVPVYVVA